MDEAELRVRPRVAAVSFLNTVPLVWGMVHGGQRALFHLDFCVPSECADRLREDRADIGIVPCVEAARQGLAIIPGCGIACEGPVRSILLISRVPFDRIRTLSADSNSRTSVMLARIVLARRYGVHSPRVAPHAADMASMLREADACLIIGDAALVLDPATIPFHVLDLGAEWKELTGLPMVFAVWAARPSLPPLDPRPFLDSLRAGMENLDRIVEQEYARRGVTRELAREYLTRYIRFELGQREYRGMALFLEYAAEVGNPMNRQEVTV